MSKWLQNAIFYEVYPQSFMDSNADGIGDFKGLENKLSYIKELGCNAIWMNPCFDSSFYDAGYDVKDYYKVAPRYGTNEDLRHLLKKAHEMGIHVLLDLVAGHTAIDHPWFQESSKDEINEYTDRYIWRTFNWEKINYDNIQGYLCGLSERPAMAAYNCFTTQPCLNYGFGKVTEDWQFHAESKEAEDTRLLLQDIMSFWLDLGCDGFRVDMAGSLVKEDEGRYYTTKLWKKIRAFLDEKYPEAVLVSEWGDPLQSLEAGFHMDFLLHNGPTHYMDLFRETPYFSATSKGNLKEFIRVYEEMYQRTKGKGLICIPSGNHDMVRMRETLTEEEMKLAFAFLLTMPGCPFIYYGDEIGMKYIHGLKSKEGGYERTGSRTPMQWSNRYNAGFSSAPPKDLYLPVDSSADFPNVEDQIEDQDSLLNHVKQLIDIRLNNETLSSNAPFRFLTEDGSYPLAYERSTEKESMIIVINTSKEEIIWEIPEEEYEIFYHYKNVKMEKNKILMNAGSYCILQKH